MHAIHSVTRLFREPVSERVEVRVGPELKIEQVGLEVRVDRHGAESRPHGAEQRVAGPAHAQLAGRRRSWRVARNVDEHGVTRNATRVSPDGGHAVQSSPIHLRAVAARATAEACERERKDHWECAEHDGDYGPRVELGQIRRRDALLDPPRKGEGGGGDAAAVSVKDAFTKPVAE